MLSKCLFHFILKSVILKVITGKGSGVWMYVAWLAESQRWLQPKKVCEKYVVGVFWAVCDRTLFCISSVKSWQHFYPKCVEQFFMVCIINPLADTGVLLAGVWLALYHKSSEWTLVTEAKSAY